MLSNPFGMNKRRVIFFAIFGVYHLIVFVFTSYIDAQKSDLGVLTSMYKFIHLFKYGALLGIGLFMTDFIWSWKNSIDSNKEKDGLKFEINNLKAKVYDLQEGAKAPVPEPDTNNDQE